MAALRWVAFSVGAALAAAVALALLSPSSALAQTPTPTPPPQMPAQPAISGEAGGFIAVLVLLAILSTLTATVNVVFLSVIASVLIGLSYNAVWVGLAVWLATYAMRIIKNLMGG